MSAKVGRLLRAEMIDAARERDPVEGPERCRARLCARAAGEQVAAAVAVIAAFVALGLVARVVMR